LGLVNNVSVIHIVASRHYWNNQTGSKNKQAEDWFKMRFLQKEHIEKRVYAKGIYDFCRKKGLKD
jgi:hypothetical protein